MQHYYLYQSTPLSQNSQRIFGWKVDFWSAIKANFLFEFRSSVSEEDKNLWRHCLEVLDSGDDDPAQADGLTSVRFQTPCGTFQFFQETLEGGSSKIYFGVETEEEIPFDLVDEIKQICRDCNLTEEMISSPTMFTLLIKH